MNRDEVLAMCLGLPAAEETYPFGDDVAVIKVCGKMFALVTLSEGPGSVNLKCDPAQALELRQAYPGIRPGYHQNKRHWITVDLDGSVDDDIVRGLIFLRPGRRRVAAFGPRGVSAGLTEDRTWRKRREVEGSPPCHTATPGDPRPVRAWPLTWLPSAPNDAHRGRLIRPRNSSPNG